MAEVSDAALVTRTAQGDIQAFETLVRRYQIPVFRLCVNMLGNEADASDVSQDVFFTLWRSISTFRGDSAFSTWVYRIATNHCLKALRKRHATRPVASPHVSSHGQPEAEFEAKEMSQRISDAVSDMTDGQRAAFVLREAQGLSYAEIATILDCSVAAVKSRLNRARVELAQALEEAP